MDVFKIYSLDKLWSRHRLEPRTATGETTDVLVAQKKLKSIMQRERSQTRKAPD